MHMDYFERLHMERVQKARNEELAKAERLNKFDGRGWKNRVTQPVEFQFNRRPERSSIKALERPILANQPASLSNSVSSLQSFMAANQGTYRYADFHETPLGTAGERSSGMGGGGGAAERYGDGGFSGFEGYYQQRSQKVPQREAARGPRGWYDGPPPKSGVHDDYRDDAEEDEEEQEDWGTLRDERMRRRAQHLKYATPDQHFDRSWGGVQNDRDDDDGGGGDRY